MDIGEDDEASLYEGPGFELPVFRKAWVCLSRCWDPEVKTDKVDIYIYIHIFAYCFCFFLDLKL